MTALRRRLERLERAGEAGKPCEFVEYLQALNDFRIGSKRLLELPAPETPPDADSDPWGYGVEHLRESAHQLAAGIVPECMRDWDAEHIERHLAAFGHPRVILSQ